MHWKSNELQSTLCKKNELQGELRNLRRELHQAHDNFTALEAEVWFIAVVSYTSDVAFITHRY